MTVRRIYAGNKIIEVTGVGYEPKGEFHQSSTPLNPQDDKDLSLLLSIGTLCSNAQLDKNEKGSWSIIGDPTEGALIVSAAKAGLEAKELKKNYPRVA